MLDWTFWLEMTIKAFALIMIVLGGFAYLTWYERRALARIQSRIGPNRVGPFGLLQPIVDAVKLIFKEELKPAKTDKIIFFLAPIVTVVPATVLAAVIPWGTSFMLFGREIRLYVANVNVGVLYITAIASIAVYGIVLAGWSSNNKYAMLGGLRASAQMISYELSLGLCFVTAIMLGNSMSLVDIVNAQRDMWFVLVQPVGALLFFIVTLAEVSRAPFDMPEAEQELTAGYHVEYSGMKFALFFMAEYEKMIIVSAILATLFFGGYREFRFLKDTFLSIDYSWSLGSWHITNWFLGPLYIFLKVVVLLFFMIWVRATLPCIRYDRLMSFGWKITLPLSLVIVFFTATGILLQDVNPLYLWLTPVLSIGAGVFAVVMIYWSLRRKLHERA